MLLHVQGRNVNLETRRQEEAEKKVTVPGREIGSPSLTSAQDELLLRGEEEQGADSGVIPNGLMLLRAIELKAGGSRFVIDDRKRRVVVLRARPL